MQDPQTNLINLDQCGLIDLSVWMKVDECRSCVDENHTI